jgi:NitT/TauT family transport system permease protein
VSVIDTELEPRTASAADSRAPSSAALEPSAMAAATSLGVAAGVALLVTLGLAPHQLPPASWLDVVPSWQHPYPVLIFALLAAALLSVPAQYFWPPIRSRVRHYAPLTAGALAVACLYELATVKYGWLQQPFFPGPDQVLGALVEQRRILLLSSWHTLRLLLGGYSAGVACGLVSGVLIGWFPRVRYWGMPVLKVLGPLPATALVPLVMTVFPESVGGAVALIGFAVWFPVTMLTSSGIASVRLSYLDVARTLGARHGYLIFRVALPSALPHIFVGLFMGLGAAFLTLIVAESVGVQAGLGWYVQWQKGYAEYANVYAALVIMAVCFSLVMTGLFLLRDRLLGWQKGVIKW